jgi:hypothetical protein
MRYDPDIVAHTPPVSREDADLRTRIRAEFSEMPGLKLTLPQAARLFHLEQPRCERALGALVEVGELSNDGKTFARRTASC